MDLIKKSKGTFFILAGVASIAGLLYYFRKKKIETPRLTPEMPKMTEKKKKDIFGSLKAEYDELENVLTIESVMSILNGVLELTMPDHAELIVKHRKDRREKYDDLNGYIDLYRQYLDSVFQIEQKAREEILAFLNVEPAMWAKSEAFYGQQQHPAIQDFNRSYYPRIKISIGSTVKLDAEELSHCLEDAKNNIIHEADAMKNIMRFGSQYSFIRDVTETRAYDLVYLMFELEEEDLIQNLEDNASHPELRDLHAAFEQSIENLNRISSMLM